LYEIKSKIAKIYTSFHHRNNDTSLKYIMPFSERLQSGKI